MDDLPKGCVAEAGLVSEPSEGSARAVGLSHDMLDKRGVVTGPISPGALVSPAPIKVRGGEGEGERNIVLGGGRVPPGFFNGFLIRKRR
jgi:hypothetical protein